MALDKLVDSTQLDSDLTSVANAIRTKGGTSASLAFPSDFVSAINAISGGGGNSFTKTTYTIASETVFNTAFNNANIPLVSQDEILIWNVKGTHQQSAGSMGAKWGIMVAQGGSRIPTSNNSTASFYQRLNTVAAPDSATPGNASTWTPDIENGYYKAPTGTSFYVGTGNTIEFIQIPYNIDWNV